MRSIDINELDRVEKSFSPAERRQITKCCDAIERMLASSRAAFDALGSPVDDTNTDAEVHTAFLTAITPALLESALPRIDGLRAFFHQEWRGATGTRGRVLARAERDCEHAAAAITTRLAEIKPIVREQQGLIERFEYLVHQLTERAKEKTCRQQ